VPSLDASIRDPETGLYARPYFDEVIGRELERAKRHGFVLSVVSVVVDIPGGAWRRAEGEPEALVAAARILQAHTRETDLVFRWERDEFLALLFEADAEDCRMKVEALAALYASGGEEAGAPSPLRVRLGCGTLHEGQVFAGVLQAARAAAWQSA
jgi:diguanylate cyclase (GGDEF)-like protein